VTGQVLVRLYCAVDTFIVLRGDKVDEHEDELNHAMSELTWELPEMVHHVSLVVAWIGGGSHG